jgi:ATP-dependent protease HslVU (ClpYQ) peptidase subunit
LTTIIVKEESGGISIAYDSQSTDSNGAAFYGTRPKVFRKGELILGVTGNVAFANAVQFEDFEEVGADPAKWAVTYLAPKLRDLAERVNTCKEVECDCVDYSVLVIAGGATFIVDSFLQVQQPKSGYHAIGSGSNYALGALAAGATVTDALEISAHFDTNTGGDLVLTTAAELLEDPAETGVLL